MLQRFILSLVLTFSPATFGQDASTSPHKFALITYGNSLSGVYDNVSTSQRFYRMKNWVAQGIKAESYFETPLQDISLLLMGYHERVNYDFDNSTGRERKYGAISGLVTFGRANIFEGTGWEVGAGIRRDRRSNKSYVLYPRIGLGSGWSVYAEYQHQFTTDRWLYNSLDGRYQEPDQNTLWAGVSKSVFQNLIFSAGWVDAEMRSGNGDSYSLDGWTLEVGYYF